MSSQDILLNLQGFFGFSFLTIYIYFYLYLLLIFDCCIAGTNSPLCCSLWELTSPKKRWLSVQSIKRIDYIKWIPVFSYSKTLGFPSFFRLSAFYWLFTLCMYHRRESTTRMAMATFRIHSIMMVYSAQPGEGGGCTPSPFHSICYRAKLTGEKHSSYFSSTLFSSVHRAFIL